MLGPRVHTVLSALAAAAAALAALVALPAPARAAQPAPGTAASLLYFQDAHEIAPVTQDGGDHGGIARLATVLNAERARGVPTDTVFGGDLGGGTLFGAVYRGAAMVDALRGWVSRASASTTSTTACPRPWPTWRPPPSRG